MNRILIIGCGFNLSYAHLSDKVKKKSKNSFKNIFHEMNMIMKSPRPEEFLRGNLIKPIFEVREITIPRSRSF